MWWRVTEGVDGIGCMREVFFFEKVKFELILNGEKEILWEKLF